MGSSLSSVRRGSVYRAGPYPPRANTGTWKGNRHRPVCSGAASAYRWLYLYGFVRPKTGATEWFTVPGVSTPATHAVFAECARAVGASKRHRRLLVLDPAGWHVAKDLALPLGIHLFHLPALPARTLPRGAALAARVRRTRQPLLLAPGRTRSGAGHPLPSTHPRSRLHPRGHAGPLVA